MMQRINTRTFGAAAITAMFAGSALTATPAAAQVQQDWEWEAGEGFHEEEWYDPSDWFDDDYDKQPYVAIDYEFSETAYDAYYDGYYDGFYDDEFGAEYWDEYRKEGLGGAYTEGYYDGFYDSTYDYSYDPIYYVFTYTDTNTRRDRDRAKDKDRERGDRANDDSNASKSEKKQARDDAMKDARVRGTITRMNRQRDAETDHTLVKLGYERMDGVTADFGPNMSFKDIPLEKGDRATLIGDMVKRDGRKVLVVEKITHDGETWTLREDGEASTG
ncbi:MAG: hypothetical protein Tsb0013_18970 [Phycisphaerales bacterium]